MTITQEQLQNIKNKLSKLDIENIEKFGNDINNILGYIEMLDEIDTTGVEWTVNVVQTYNRLREDMIEKYPKSMLENTKQKVVAKQIALNNIMK